MKIAAYFTKVSTAHLTVGCIDAKKTKPNRRYPESIPNLFSCTNI